MPPNGADHETPTTHTGMLDNVSRPGSDTWLEVITEWIRYIAP